MPALLEVSDLRTSFFMDRTEVKAVNGVSFTVAARETLALVGESGCGKSVTALSIMRLIASPPGKILEGKVMFDGADLLTLSNRDMNRVRGKGIGMVFQEPMTSLNPVLNIGRQLTEGMKRHLGLSPAAAYKRAVELLEMVGIPEPEQRLAQYPHQLSGGMRQRVMIAIAISCEPKLIIADEPTTALDVTIQAQVLELMKDLTRRLGAALIIITHNLGVVARYADSICVMYGGRIIERGTAADVYADPRHPYTRGLLQSVPRLDRPKTAQLDPIEGQPPDLARLPSGCAFHPRCKYVIDRCMQERPSLLSAGRSSATPHEAACWVADRLEPAAAATIRTGGR